MNLQNKIQGPRHENILQRRQQSEGYHNSQGSYDLSVDESSADRSIANPDAVECLTHNAYDNSSAGELQKAKNHISNPRAFVFVHRCESA